MSQRVIKKILRIIIALLCFIPFIKFLMYCISENAAMTIVIFIAILVYCYAFSE